MSSSMKYFWRSGGIEFTFDMPPDFDFENLVLALGSLETARENCKQSLSDREFYDWVVEHLEDRLGVVDTVPPVYIKEDLTFDGSVSETVRHLVKEATEGWVMDDNDAASVVRTGIIEFSKIIVDSGQLEQLEQLKQKWQKESAARKQ